MLFYFAQSVRSRQEEAETQQYCNRCESIGIFDERSSTLTSNQRNNCNICDEGKNERL